MRQLHDNLWVHEGSMRLAGVELPLRTTIVKLTSGGLWVHSPTVRTPELNAAVDALGPVSAVVAPSNGHHLWLQEWQDACPKASVYVSRGIPKKLPGLRAHRVLDAHTPPPWPEDLEQQVMRGVPLFDECVFLHKASRSLIVTDLVQNHRGQEHHGFAKLMSKLVLEPIGFKDVCIAPPLRFGFMIKDRAAFAEAVRRVCAWEFERILVTHGAIIDRGAKTTFERLMRRFTSG